MPGKAISANLSFNPQHQTADQIQKVVANILNMAGCGHCGRLAALKVDFVVDPPDAQLKDAGVISVNIQHG